MQVTSSKYIVPRPRPTVAQLRAAAPGNETTLHIAYCYDTENKQTDVLPFELSPSSLQTTAASVLSQLSSHTVPQIPPKQISTLPNAFTDTLPPVTLTSPSLHPAKCPMSRQMLSVWPVNKSLETS